MKNRFPKDYRDRPANEGAPPPLGHPLLPYTTNPEGLARLGDRYLNADKKRENESFEKE